MGKGGKGTLALAPQDHKVLQSTTQKAQCDNDNDRKPQQHQKDRGGEGGEGGEG